MSPTVVLLAAALSVNHTAPPTTITVEITSLKVLTLNLACRGTYPLEGCDNCKTRFDAMAEAFEGNEGSSYAGIPDLSTVDVIIAQELGTTPEKYAQITAALKGRGFVYTSGNPGPIPGDAQCSDPPGLLFGQAVKTQIASLTKLDSGGLVTFSKHEIVKTVKHNWCAHNLPVPAGYLMTLLDVGHNRRAAVFNLHMMPEYNFFGVPAEDVRAYQFSEVTAFADKLGAALAASGVAYSVLFGGDFNEDIYSRSSTSAAAQCAKIGDETVKAKFAQVGIDLAAACAASAIGVPTWDPTNNDLAKRFSKGSDKHQVLDLLVQHSTSASESAPAAANHVHVLRTVKAWSGQFCDDATLGVLGSVKSGTATALTDHNAVTASFTLPSASSASAAGAAAAVDTVVSAWSGQVAHAACGQAGISCVVDSNCCNADYSWTGVKQHCDAFFKCKSSFSTCSLFFDWSAWSWSWRCSESSETARLTSGSSLEVTEEMCAAFESAVGAVDAKELVAEAEAANRITTACADLRSTVVQEAAAKCLAATSGGNGSNGGGSNEAADIEVARAVLEGIIAVCLLVIAYTYCVRNAQAAKDQLGDQLAGVGRERGESLSSVSEI
jgi:hypothetical protein